MNLIPCTSVVATAILVIFAASCSLPIFAFEIDQSENKHQQSIKSAPDEALAIDEVVSPTSSRTATINQEQRRIEDVEEDDENDEEDSMATAEDESSGAPTTLQTDLFEFIDLIPDEVNELKVRYYVSDPKVRQAFEYLKSYDYSFIKRDLFEIGEIKRAVSFVESRGLNLKEVGTAMYDKFGPPDHIFKDEELHSRNTGGFYALFDNILDEIPQDEVVTLFFNKVDSSPNFSDFLEWIGSNDFKELLNALRYNKDVQRFVFGLRDNGIDVVKIYKLLRNYFGFGNRR